jgi:hypothetical protein
VNALISNNQSIIHSFTHDACLLISFLFSSLAYCIVHSLNLFVCSMGFIRGENEQTRGTSDNRTPSIVSLDERHSVRSVFSLQFEQGKQMVGGRFHFKYPHIRQVDIRTCFLNCFCISRLWLYATIEGKKWLAIVIEVLFSSGRFSILLPKSRQY